MTKCPPLKCGQYLLYVDDILVTGHSEQACQENTLTVLKHLHQEGHKASRSKLQFSQSKVTYLGHVISANGKQLAEDRKTAILKTPKPETKQQMMSFLGLCNYCRTWLPNYTKNAQPLQNLIHGKQMAMKDTIIWTSEADKSFVDLKTALQTDTTLGFPDYTLSFTLYVSSHQGYMSAALTQPFGGKQRPIAYYSKKLDAVASGLPGCVQACVAIAEAIEQSADVVLMHPLEVEIEHAVPLILLQTPLPYVTNARLLSLISQLLSMPHITFTRCKKVNVAALLATPIDGTQHDCKADIERDTAPRTDISKTCQPHQIALYVDGSAQKDDRGRNRVGYAVTTMTDVLEKGSLPPSYLLTYLITPFSTMHKYLHLFQSKSNGTKEEQFKLMEFGTLIKNPSFPNLYMKQQLW